MVPGVGRYHATPTQIALAWLVAQRPWIVPIPGTTKLARLEENVASLSLGLDAADIREIERAAAAVPVQAERYPEKLERQTGI